MCSIQKKGIYIYVFHQSHHLEHLLVTSVFLLLKVIILGSSFGGTRGTSFFGGASSVLECLFLQSAPFSEMPRRWIVGLFCSGFFHDTCIECICIHIVTCTHARQCIRCNEKTHDCVCDAYVHTYVYNVQINIHILYYIDGASWFQTQNGLSNDPCLKWMVMGVPKQTCDTPKG